MFDEFSSKTKKSINICDTQDNPKIPHVSNITPKENCVPNKQRDCSDRQGQINAQQYVNDYNLMMSKFIQECTIMKHLNKNLHINHNNLNCPSICSNKINIDNLIELLSYSRCKKLRIFALKMLKVYDIDTIILYVPILVHNMRIDLDNNILEYYSSDKQDYNSTGTLHTDTIIGDFLLKYSSKSQLFFYNYYYQLKCQLKIGDHTTLACNSSQIFNFYKLNMLKLKKNSSMYSNVKRWSKLKNILK